MKYLCLIYSEERQWETMARAEYRAVMDEFFAFTEQIQGNGKYVAGEGLRHTGAATTVRVRQGKISTTDGPFAETKEQLGGFYLIDATDLKRRHPDRVTDSVRAIRWDRGEAGGGGNCGIATRAAGPLAMTR